MEVIVIAKTDTLNIRIEPELKKEVEITLNDLGMNITDDVTIFLKQVIMTESIPFIIKKPKFSDKMLEAIKEADCILLGEKIINYNSINLKSEQDKLAPDCIYTVSFEYDKDGIINKIIINKYFEKNINFK